MLLIRDIKSILTLDPGRRILEHHSILIDNDKILRIDDTAGLDRDHLETVRRQGKVIDASDCVVVPAYINTHVHTVEHLSRGLIPDDLATFDWASQYATPFCASLTEDEAYVSAQLACLEMISNGTGSFVDVNVLASLGHLDAVAQAVEESGMRAVLGRGVTDILPAAKQGMSEPMKAAVCHSSTQAALAEVEALLSRGPQRAQGRIRFWASIYGLMFFCSDSLFRGIRDLAERFDTPLAFHIASSREEALESESRTGAWPITHLDRLGVLTDKLLLTHCTLVTDEEVSRLAERGTKVAYCPGAALRLAKGTTQVGKIPEMIEKGVTVSLGADGTSSSGSFDPLRLAFLAAGLFKDARQDPMLIPAHNALEMITIDGAKATLSDRSTGSIEEGKQADLTIYDTTGPQWVPHHDRVRTMIYSVDGRSVRTVLVAGQIIYENGHCTRFDEQTVIERANECGARIAARIGLDARPAWPVEKATE